MDRIRRRRGTSGRDDSFVIPGALEGSVARRSVKRKPLWADGTIVSKDGEYGPFRVNINGRANDIYPVYQTGEDNTIEKGDRVRVVFTYRNQNCPQILTPLRESHEGGPFGGRGFFEDIGEAPTAIWLAFGQSFDRRHGVLGDYADTPLTAAEILNNPVHFRYGTAGLYVWSSFQSEVEEEEDPPDNWGKITAPGGSKSTDKIWHDLLVSEVAAGDTGVDLVVGLISDATDVILNDGSPTGPTWTEDPACLVALDAETLEEKWRTCLEPFDFEVDDGGGIDIGF